jgi:hypothetical protein
MTVDCELCGGHSGPRSGLGITGFTAPGHNVISELTSFSQQWRKKWFYAAQDFSVRL